MNVLSAKLKHTIKLILSLSYFIPNMVFGQASFSNCERIRKVDESIYEFDHGIRNDEKKIDSIKEKNKRDTLGIQNKLKAKTRYVIDIVSDSLIPLLGIDIVAYNKDIFKQKLDCITHTETITWLEYEIDKIIGASEDSLDQSKIPINYPEALKEMLAMIHIRIDEIMSKEFSFYGFTETSKKFVKYIYVDHSNDFLSLLGKNDDRDYTGGFRIEIATDWLKLRFFSGFKDKGWNPNSRNWYSYQTLFLGGEGYTPFLRDTTIFKTPTSYDPDDRPFASYKYLGRAKYRVSRLGHIRILSEIKVGSIGSSAPKVIQSAIHRDITTSSLKPNGWDAQIAAGGRIAFGYHVSHEFMLLSKGWLFNSALTKK